MQLLQDTFIIEQLQVINEGKADGPMKIRGVFGRCNEKNNNGRIYPTSVLQSQLDKVSPLIMERRLCGELDHPQNDTVKLSNASHLITHLEMKGQELIGEAELLKTPAGMTAQALINGGVKIGISSRGMGTLSEDHNGDKVVNEDFKLVTFDLVADPSTRGAYPGLSESTEGKFARETQTRLQREDNFVTLLKSRMRDAYQPFIEEANGAKVAAAGETKQDPGTMSAEQMRIANLRTTRTATAEGKHASVRRRRKGLLASTEGEFALIKADGHWHKMAYALHASLHEGIAAASDDLARDLLDDQPEDKTGVGMAAHERRRGLRKHHRSTLRTAKRFEKYKTKEDTRRIKKTRAASRKQDLKDTQQRTGETRFRKWKGTVEREAEAEGKATKIKGAAGGAAKGMAAAQEKIETEKGNRKAAKIKSGGRSWKTLGFRKKGTEEIEAKGTERALDVTAAGEEGRASRKHAGEQSREDDVSRRKIRRADDEAAADTRRGHREVRRDKTERLKSKVHGTAVDAATGTGQAIKRFGKAAKEAVGEKYMDKRKENLEVKDILDTEKRRQSGLAQGDEEKAEARRTAARNKEFEPGQRKRAMASLKVTRHGPGAGELETKKGGVAGGKPSAEAQGDRPGVSVGPRDKGGDGSRPSKTPPKVPAEHREEQPDQRRNGAPHPGQPQLPAGKQPPREVEAEVVPDKKPLQLGRGASKRDPDVLKKVAAGGRSGQRHGQGLKGGGIAAASADRSAHVAARGVKKPVPSSSGERSTARVSPDYADRLKTQAHMRKYGSKSGASPDEGGGPRPKAGRQTPGKLGQQRRAQLQLTSTEYHRFGSLLAEILQ